MLPNAQPKPERRTRVKRRKDRRQRLSRAQCRAVVFQREKGCCERCGRKVTDDTEPWRDDRAQVNEKVPRSRGGSPYNPDNCELICRKCHFPKGRHAPTKARMDQILRGAKVLPKHVRMIA